MPGFLVNWTDVAVGRGKPGKVDVKGYTAIQDAGRLFIRRTLRADAKGEPLKDWAGHSMKSTSTMKWRDGKRGVFLTIAFPSLPTCQ
ncbi:MAG: hypothetical protein Ct9H300mP8_10750 [Gammaproteobacteria bacterium]|nr:MAG: hypothetical protein Ct9H300mP8_10750 [Gammaproteobacteria bacterium]